MVEWIGNGILSFVVFFDDWREFGRLIDWLTDWQPVDCSSDRLIDWCHRRTGWFSLSVRFSASFTNFFHMILGRLSEDQEVHLIGHDEEGPAQNLSFNQGYLSQPAIAEKDSFGAFLRSLLYLFFASVKCILTTCWVFCLNLQLAIHKASAILSSQRVKAADTKKPVKNVKSKQWECCVCFPIFLRSRIFRYVSSDCCLSLFG